MKAKILSYTNNPIETIYIGYRNCYSKNAPSLIEIPTEDEMIEFIKKFIHHESPLEHCNFTFAIEGVSRALSHQLVRHRIASYSQKSQRYVKEKNFDYVVPKTIKDNLGVHAKYEEIMSRIQLAYNWMTEQGIPQEDVRYMLPNACETNLVMTMNVRELRHFLDERLCKHAQWEIRELAELIVKEVEKIIPFVIYKCRKCGKTCFECYKE